MKVLDIHDSTFLRIDIVDFLRRISDDFVPSLQVRIIEKSNVNSLGEYVDKLLLRGEILICENEGNIVGLLGYYCNNKQDNISHFTILAVQRELTRKGIATLLLHDAMCRVQHLGFKAVQLETSSINAAAVALYLRNGFIVEEQNDSVIKFIKYFKSPK